jgi:hypothetical protein
MVEVLKFSTRNIWGREGWTNSATVKKTEFQTMLIDGYKPSLAGHVFLVGYGWKGTQGPEEGGEWKLNSSKKGKWPWWMGGLAGVGEQGTVFGIKTQRVFYSSFGLLFDIPENRRIGDIIV